MRMSAYAQTLRGSLSVDESRDEDGEGRKMGSLRGFEWVEVGDSGIK